MAVRSLVWRASARDDLTTIITYIAGRDPGAARRMRSLIEQAVLPLTKHPFVFRVGRVAETRELGAHPNYIVIYRVANHAVESSTSCTPASNTRKPPIELRPGLQPARIVARSLPARARPPHARRTAPVPAKG